MNTSSSFRQPLLRLCTILLLTFAFHLDLCRADDNDAKNNKAKPMVLGLGPGRTGTDSLRTALIELGFGPTYHMKELVVQESGISTEGHQQIFWNASKGLDFDFYELLKDFNSGVDWPISAFPEELLEAFPNAKFVLTKRSAKGWYRSIESSICRFSARLYPIKLLKYLSPLGPPFSRWKIHPDVMDSVMSNKFAPGIVTSMTELCNSEAKAIAALEQWYDKVEKIIPAEQLLVFELGVHGYHELSQFLNVEEPLREYPRVNSGKELNRSLQLLWCMLFGVIFAVAAVPTTILYLLWNRKTMTFTTTTTSKKVV